MTQNLDRFKLRAWHKEKKIISEVAFLDLCLLKAAVNVDDLILMQCTGLTDKLGKLICEGDIVKTYLHWPRTEYREPETECYINYIVHKHDRFQFGRCSELFFRNDFDDFVGVERGRCRPNLLDWYLSIEIIGNIYENPELLNN